MKTLRKTISDGIKTLYDVDFELGYLERGHVYVYAGEDNSLYETQLTYVWQNDTQIELTVPEEYVEGTIINIRRIAPRDTLYVLFKNSTGVTELSLNSANLQALMLIEEQDDGFKPVGYYEKQDLSFDGIYTIKNLLDGIDPQDPVTMKQMFDVNEGFMSQFVIAATAQANKAEDKANIAEEWAEKPEDSEVETGKYSALHHATKSAASAASIELPDYSTGKAGEPIVRNIAGDGWELGPVASNPNIIINGSGIINQRYNASGGTITNNQFITDRWSFYANTGSWNRLFGSSEGIFGFGIYSNNTYAPAPEDYLMSVRTRTDGFDARDLLDAEAITISFKARSSVAGIHTLCFLSYHGSAEEHRYIAEFNIPSIDTWEDIEVTINIPTGYITDQGTNKAFELFIGTLSGTNRHAAHGIWDDNPIGISTINAVNWAATIGNIFRVTNVKMEIGTIATPYKNRSYGEELLLCQRYYWDTNSGVLYLHPIYNSTTNLIRTREIFFPTPMRSAPTVLKTLGTGIASVSSEDLDASRYRITATANTGTSSATLLNVSFNAEL